MGYSIAWHLQRYRLLFAVLKNLNGPNDVVSNAGNSEYALYDR
jgi:hypothetical protein